MQNVEGCFIVADEHRLGNFQFQPVRRQSGRRQRGNDLQRQGAASKLNRRHVDRELDVVGPRRGLGAGRRQHPLADLIDQAGVFGDWDELSRRDHAAFGMPPAQQGFAAGDRVVANAEAGLIVDLQTAVCDRLAQIHFQDAARLHLCVHVGLEETISPAPGGLGGIHRQIRVL